MGLSKKNIRIQAEQFLGYFSRFKDEGLDEVFGFWVESKDFDEETKRLIRVEVNKIFKGGASNETA